jgi:hypothetical protein
MEMMEYGAIAGAALRKYRYPIAVVERLCNVIVYSGRVTALRALDEQGTHIIAQPTKQGPTADFRFCDKSGRAYAHNRIHVQPGYMIGRQHYALCSRGRQYSLMAHSDSQN